VAELQRDDVIGQAEHVERVSSTDPPPPPVPCAGTPSTPRGVSSV
jgi:hypothetical protein